MTLLTDERLSEIGRRALDSQILPRRDAAAVDLVRAVRLSSATRRFVASARGDVIDLVNNLRRTRTACHESRAAHVRDLLALDDAERRCGDLEQHVARLQTELATARRLRKETA